MTDIAFARPAPLTAATLPIAAPAPAGQFHLRLGIAFALAVSVGSIIGSGILGTPGLVANQIPHPWLLIAMWALGGVHILLSANVASELITAIPKAGGIYVPVRAAFGEAMGLLSGWADWLSNTGAVAALSIACATFLGAIFPGLTPYHKGVAVAFALAIIALNWRGVREGQVTQTVGGVIKVALIGGVIAVAFLADPIPVSTVVERASAATRDAAPAMGVFAVIAGYQLIYATYTGWHAPIYFVEEDPKAITNIPRALVLSIVAVAVIYVALNLGLLSALDIAAFRASSLPVSLVMENAFGRSGGVLIALLSIAIVVVTLNAIVMSCTRTLYGMARDGLFLPVAMRVNAGGTPHVALGITAVLALALIFSGAFVFLFKLTAALAIFAFVLYEASLFALRIKQPDLHRPFRAIGYPVLPALVCLLDFGLLIAFIAADPVSGLYMAGLIAICVPVGVILHRRRYGE